MKKVVFAILFTLGCTNDSGALEALNGEGFTAIKLTGWEISCSKDDNSCTGFIATGPSGKRVTGAVGCGWFFKGCTVRITGVAQ